MRTPKTRYGLLSISTAMAIIAVTAVTTASQAQMRGGGGMNGGFRGGGGMAGGMRGGGGTMNGGPIMRPVHPPVMRSIGRGTYGRIDVTEPRLQRFRHTEIDDVDVRRGKGKRPGTRIVVTDPPRGEAPTHPGRRPREGGPQIGVIGPVIGTGVAVGTTGPAGGGVPPSGTGSPPPSGGNPAARGGATVALRGGVNIPPPNEQRFVKGEVLLEFPGNVSDQVSNAVAVRNRLTRLERAYLPLTNTTFFRWKIADRRSVRTVLNQLGRETGLLFVQANFLYRTTQDRAEAEAAAPQPPQGSTFSPPADTTLRVTPAVATAAAVPAAGDPAQYVLSKLRINEAHSLANGDQILVAVIDSGIDLGHPELQGAVAGSFDALGKAERPHSHGTAIAGAIAAHARLMGAAPAARILAIRAFGSGGASAEATSMAIIKGVEYASAQRARIINMSFAGPADPGLARHLAAAKAKGAVLIAASGNFGPKSPPQYPAADPNVIAVSATDADDRMFRASNIGPHIAVAAPGVDILLPAPDREYQTISGTSFSAAYVSGVAALVLQRSPGLTPDGVRKILESTAKDLGPAGKDSEFGFGLVDAYQAILAVQSSTAAGPQDAPKQSATAQ